MGTGYLHVVSRRVITAAIVVAAVGLFAWEWTAAPRVHADPRVRQELAGVRGEQYLGTRFEGLPLQEVRPFLYSDCAPGKPHVVACHWLRVDRGRVSGSDPAQVIRARGKLRPVG
jgi:hypothetical protein